MKKASTVLLTLFLTCMYCGAVTAAPKTTGDVYHTRLSNGLTIITQEVKDSPLASINVFVRAGSKDELPQTEGITHFCEHLFFRGTSSSSGTEFKGALEALGGFCNAETTKDYTRYYINIPSTEAMKGLQLMTDALQNACFDQKEIEQERKVIVEEYKMTSDSASHFFNNTICEMAFPVHPYGRPIIGKEKNIKSFKRPDFLAFRNRFYTPENLIFVVTGNISTEKVSSYLAGIFDHIPNSGQGEHILPQEKIPGEKHEKTVQKNVDDVSIVQAYYGPSIKDRDYIYATDVLCFMLGNGKSSILSRILIDGKDLIKEIDVSFLTQKDPGLIMVFSTLKTKDIALAKKEIQAALENVGKGNFSEDDMKRAKNLIINSSDFGSETNDGKATNLGFYESIDSYEFAVTYVQNLMKVTKEDIIKTYNKYFTAECCALTVKPKPKKVEDDDE
ncbi:MAG: M16 family metallopeptidase [Vulcanimicrobiota bacterium]